MTYWVKIRANIRFHGSSQQEYNTELNDFNDFKSTITTLEKSANEQAAENVTRQHKVDQKITHLEEASTMLIEKLNKVGKSMPFQARWSTKGKRAL